MRSLTTVRTVVAGDERVSERCLRTLIVGLLLFSAMKTGPRNLGVLVVLLLGAAGAGAVLAAAVFLARPSEDSDIAISVNGVPITFGEFRHRIALVEARDEVYARALDPADPLMAPGEAALARVSTRAVQRFNDDWSVEVQAAAELINEATSISEARRLGVEPTAEEIAAEVEAMLASERRVLESSDPTTDFGAALLQARRDAFADGEYEREVIPKLARWQAARANVLEESPTPAGQSLVTAAFTAMTAHIEIDEGLGVTSEEIRDYLDQFVLVQIELRQLNDRIERDAPSEGGVRP